MTTIRTALGEGEKAHIASRLPKDFNMTFVGDTLGVHATCATTNELDALVEALLLLRHTLTSHRKAVAADFGMEKPEIPFAQRVMAWLG